jgi:antitoxin VapB
MGKVLNIKNAETYELASQLADLKGETLKEAVTRSLRERLDRETQRAADHDLVDRIMAIVKRHRGPIYDSRTEDEILGYDEHGIPR